MCPRIGRAFISAGAITKGRTITTSRLPRSPPFWSTQNLRRWSSKPPIRGMRMNGRYGRRQSCPTTRSSCRVCSTPRPTTSSIPSWSPSASAASPTSSAASASLPAAIAASAPSPATASSTPTSRSRSCARWPKAPQSPQSGCGAERNSRMIGTPFRIAVIGGGIGGLTAALALRQAGFEVEVYEQAPELTEVGGGINMAPNATRVLRRLGLVPAERIADLGLELGSQSWVGPGGHFVHYFVSRGRLLNFVGWTEHDEWNREDWTDRATVARALTAFAGWHEQVRTIVAAAETCFMWALFDRDPLPRWSAGRTTLLGDACHPMYPFMGHGAAMAIEDGAALAACLRTIGNPTEALLRYERLRLPRVTRLQAMSRANKTRFHLRDGPAQQARDAEWAKAGDRSPTRCAGST